ncbi:unnamed protein product [Prunus armeniaca]
MRRLTYAFKTPIVDHFRGKAKSPSLGIHSASAQAATEESRDVGAMFVPGHLLRELELLLVYQFLDDVSQNNAIVSVVRPRTVVFAERLSFKLLRFWDFMAEGQLDLFLRQ